jgi:hypothetical protein
MLITGLLAEKCHGLVHTRSIAGRPLSYTTNSSQFPSNRSASPVTPETGRVGGGVAVITEKEVASLHHVLGWDHENITRCQF